MTRKDHLLRHIPTLTLLVVGCSVPSDEKPAPISLPFDDAAAVRGLAFRSTPALRVMTRDDVSREASDALDTSQAREAREPYRLLGFFSEEEAELGAIRGRSAYAAQYIPSAKTITVVGQPASDVLVHELVHALQDQHFNLQRYDHTTTSTDEGLARRAVVEGDAVLAQQRWLMRQSGRDPLASLPALLGVDRVTTLSDKSFAEDAAPYFYSYQAFCYPFGAAYVATKAGLFESTPRWSLNAIDALFAEPPRSTEEVLRRGVDVDPIVPVGLSALPDALADKYTLDRVDRLGAWLTHVLLRRVASSASSASSVHGVEAWDGDQLLVLRERDNAIPPPPPKLAVVWTSVWDDEASASTLATSLARLHGALRDETTGDWRANRDAGDTAWVARRGDRVVFARGVSPSEFSALTASAFDGDAPLTPRGTQ